MNVRCSIAGCDAPTVAHRLCRKHYMRVKRHGCPEPGNTRAHSRAQIIAKIAARTTKTETGCWEWQGAVGPNGYGYSAWGGQMLAHRMAYEAHVGPIPAGLHIDHLCRNRRCVNPEHLEPVAPAVNMQRKPDERRQHGYCKRGHKIDPDNSIVSAGTRRCRICREEYLREWRLAHVA